MCQHFTTDNIRIITFLTAFIYMFNILHVNIFVFVFHITFFGVFLIVTIYRLNANRVQKKTELLL